MTLAEKHINHYNNLHGKVISKKALAEFHAVLKADIARKRIDEHGPIGAKCIEIEKRISKVLTQNWRQRLIETKRIDVDELIRNHTVEPTKSLPLKMKSQTKITIQKQKQKKENKPVKHTKRIKLDQHLKGLGFIAGDVPIDMASTFQLPGQIGEFLGRQQRYKLEIIISGETHSSKSELAKQLADAFLSAGFNVGYIDWEHGGRKSINTEKGLQRNLSPENINKLIVSGDMARDIEKIKGLAKYFDVVIMDSGTKLNKGNSNKWVDELREEQPNTIWVIIMQQTERGVTRGGTAAEFDAPVVIKTYRGTHYGNNYAMMYKNRGNATNTKYNITAKQLIRHSENA